jgi:hypothetical protein
MEPDQRLTERDLSGLRVVLNDWDPIGVVGADSDGPEDEYDCLRWPLVSRFQRDASRTEVGDFLRTELHDHFGLDVLVTDKLLDQLFAWWETAR